MLYHIAQVSVVETYFAEYSSMRNQTQHTYIPPTVNRTTEPRITGPRSITITNISRTFVSGFILS